MLWNSPELLCHGVRSWYDLHCSVVEITMTSSKLLTSLIYTSLFLNSRGQFTFRWTRFSDRRSAVFVWTGGWIGIMPCYCLLVRIESGLTRSRFEVISNHIYICVLLWRLHTGMWLYQNLRSPSLSKWARWSTCLVRVQWQFRAQWAVIGLQRYKTLVYFLLDRAVIGSGGTVVAFSIYITYWQLRGTVCFVFPLYLDNCSVDSF